MKLLLALLLITNLSAREYYQKSAKAYCFKKKNGVEFCHVLFTDPSLGIITDEYCTKKSKMKIKSIDCRKIRG